MAREWTDLFISDTISSRGDGDDGAAQAPERKRRFFSRLRSNLSKTREALGAEVKATLLEGDVDEETWERLEEALIMADVGASTTARVVGELEQEASGGDLVGGEALSRRLEEMLAAIARTGDDRIDLRASPTVIMAVGVNGTGKTTTIGKLAWHLQRELGLKVVLGAADTFRAAAVAQLEGWAERAGSEIVTGREGSDPGA
ncbi:MAG: fused signal recognition particle receptor, partial [Solirubrobacteraceae bacterium]|nr:fused signal recognition particle receptor [Solirubrobacteraceae bacterium]